MPNDPLRRPKEAAEFIGGGEGKTPTPLTLQDWRTKGIGPEYVKVGHAVFYRESALNRWLDSRTVKTEAA